MADVYNTYPLYRKSVLDGLTVKAMLLDETATYSAAHEFVADVVAKEIAGGSYARQDVSGTTSVDTGVAIFTPSGSITFTNVTATVGAIAFYHHTGSDATAQLLGILTRTPVSYVAQNVRVDFTDNLLEFA